MKNNNLKTSEILSSQLGAIITKSPSPLMLWLAPYVREVDDTSLTFEYEVTQVMSNPVGTLHGGIIAAIMDDMIGATIINLGRVNFYTTINNVIDYLSTAKIGDIITGKTKIIKAGRQVINVQFELWNLEKKRLLARGYSNNLDTGIPMADNLIIIESNDGTPTTRTPHS